MRVDRRLGRPLACAAAFLMLASGRALAETGVTPVEPAPAAAMPDSWWLIPIAFLALVVGAVVLFVVRPGARRPLAALAILLAAGFVGLVMALAALFSDFSGRHEIKWEWLAVGGVVIVAGVALSVGVARGGRRTGA